MMRRRVHGKPETAPIEPATGASRQRRPSNPASPTVVATTRAAGVTQRAAPEEELLQGRFGVAQRAAPEEELQMQAAPDDEELQMQAAPDDEELQMREAPARNATGLPDRLKAGIESMSGMSLDGVRVHYNSPQPAQLNALAFAQGTDIHVGPGQERHLPHEAWHIVQQAQGRVKPTTQLNDGVPVNDDASLEREADTMGAKALSSADAVQRRVMPASVRQMIRFQAGIGSDWHVHKDHVKYDSNNQSRVDFTNRTAAVVLAKLAEVIARRNLQTTTGSDHYADCVQWIQDNLS